MSNSKSGLFADFKEMQSTEAKQLQNYADAIQKHTLASFIGRQTAPAVLNQLTYGHPGVKALSDFNDGWDGFGASAPSTNVIQKANDVLDFAVGAFGHSLELPSVSPGSSGLVAFTWKSGNGRKQLELWIADDTNFCADWCISNYDGSMSDGELCSFANLSVVFRKFLE